MFFLASVCFCSGLPFTFSSLLWAPDVCLPAFLEPVSMPSLTDTRSPPKQAGIPISFRTVTSWAARCSPSPGSPTSTSASPSATTCSSGAPCTASPSPFPTSPSSTRVTSFRMPPVCTPGPLTAQTTAPPCRW